jgi:hypothetical protein
MTTPQRSERRRRRIVRMELLEPASGGAGEREMALVTSAAGTFECFWRLDEPELRRHFEGANVAYFEAEGEGADMRVVARVPDQG